VDLRGNFIVESYLAGLKFQGSPPTLDNFHYTLSAVDPTPLRTQFSMLVNTGRKAVSGLSYT
jgi:hypothetical protein